MATLGQRNAGRGVTAYDPTRRLGGRVAPTSRTSSPPPVRGHVGGGGGSLLSRMAATSSQRTQQKKEEEKEQYGTGLGYLLNNPVTKGALGAVSKPLEVLDYGRRAFALANEQAAMALPEPFEAFLPTTMLIDEGRVRDDERSNREKFFDPGYGWGQIMYQFDTGNELVDTWGNRVTGFLADVGFDPLTYVTAGVGGVAGKSGRAGYSAAARVAGREAVETAARNGVDEAGQALIRSKWLRASDEIGRLGPGGIKDVEVLEAIGLQKQGLRFGSPFSPGKGMRIGGDGRIGDALGEVARKTNRTVGKARAGFYDTSVGGRLASWRTPADLVKAHKVIRGGGEPVGGMEMPYALGIFMFHEGDRLGSKSFRGKASPGFEALAKGLRGEEAVEATRMAQRGGTAWNAYGDQLHKMAGEAGIDIPYRKNFVPHILTNEGKDLFRASEELRKLTGTMVTHLDDPSGVTLERTLVDGKHNINGIEVDFGSGTIDEKNRALRDAFGVEKAYDDNITQIYSKYVNRLSSDAGLMAGLERLSDQMPELVVRSDDPEGMLRIFHELVDDAATTKANQDLLPGLRARLSRLHAAIKDTDDRALEALEKGRSIIADASGENLSNIRSFRDSTRRVLAQLEGEERDLVKRRDKIVGVLDSEIADMHAREQVLQKELATLRSQEMAAQHAIANAVSSQELRAAALERATQISAAKRRTKTALAELQADRDQVDSLSNTLRGAQLKQEILGRALTDPTITPRPLEAFPTNVPGPRDPSGTTTKGESFKQLAASGLKPEDTNYLFVTDAEKAYNEAIESGAFEELTLPEQRKMMGAADRARRENIDNAAIDYVGEQFQIEGTQGRSAHDIEADFAQRRQAAELAEIERMYREEELAGGGIVPGLTPNEQRALTVARKNKTIAKTELDDFVLSPEGQAWIEARSAVDDVRYLANPEVRYKATPPAKGDLRAEADAARSQYEALMSRANEGARPRPVNKGAVQSAQSEIRMRMSKLADFEEQMATATGPHLAYLQEQTTKLAAEMQEIEQRLVDLTGDQGTYGKRLPIGARRAQVTAAKQRAEKLAAELKAADRATSKEAKRVAQLIERIDTHDATIKKMSAKAGKVFTGRGTDQSHLELSAILQKLDEDEALALRRAANNDLEIGIAPELRLRTEPAYSTVGNPRLRLPRTRPEIEADIAALERAGQPYVLPSDPAQRKAIEGGGVVFPLNTGDRSSEAIANRVLATTEIVAPYRALLVHTGAISPQAAQAHSTMVTDLASTVSSYLNNRTSVNLQNVVNQTDKVRRANEFLARYAKAIDAGVEPDPALAQRITREIVGADLERAKRQLADLRKNPNAPLDMEAEQLTQAVYQTIEDMSSANSDKQFANSMLRKKGLRPDQERALIEARIAEDGNNTFMIDWSQRNIRNNQAKKRRAIAAGDDHALANAERAIATNKQTLESMRAARKQMEDRLEELGSTQSNAVALNEVADVVNSMATTPLTPEGVAILSKYMSGEDVEDLRHFAEFGGITGTDDPDAFLDFLAGQLKKAGKEAEEAAEGRAPLDALTLAATFQASADYNNARMLFAEMFQDLGMKRGTDLSMEASLGYNRSKDILNYDVMHKAVRRHLEAQRGMSDTDFMMRELESRVNRMESVHRGLGNQARARDEIVGWDEAGNVVRSRYKADEKLPPIKAGMDEALAADMPPEEWLAGVAKAQGRQPVEDLRAARQAERKAASAPEPYRGLPTVSWEDAIFGEGTTPRPTLPVFRAQGEQAARAMRGTRTDIPHPSAALTRGGPSAELRTLHDELRPYWDREQDLFFAGKRAEATIAETKPKLREAQAKVKAGEKTVKSLQDVIDTKGTPLPPAAAQAKTAEAVDKRYSGMIGRREEELGQLATKKAAYNKAITNELEEIGPELSLTRKAIIDVTEVLEGPQARAREMPPVGGWDAVPEPEPLSGEPDFGRLALPAAGESAASRSVAQRLEKAKESAKLVQKNTMAAGYEMGGPAAVSLDFDKVMADLGMPRAETMFVRNLVAEAVGAEKEGELLAKGAKALEGAIAKAEANKLATVSESLLLANWKPMVEELAKGADGQAKYYMEQTMHQYFTRLNEVLPTNRFWKAIEAYTNFFKTYATMRPDFHIRNATSGVFMNSTDGVPVRYNFSAIKAWKQFMDEPQDHIANLRKAGDAASGYHGLTNSQLADAFEVALGTGAGGQFAERGVGGTSNRLFLNNPLTRGSKKLGEYVEGPMRLAMAMDSMKKGSDVYEALARVTRIHFDYSEVSTFDAYAKRMIPFWTFMSRNLPMQITQMLTKPRWYAGYNSFRRNFSAEGDPLAPEYWSDSGGFQLPDSPLNDLLGTDDPIWLTPDLAHNRLESDLQSMVGTATLQDPSFLSNLNPAFSTPAQLLMKKDFFTGKNYGEKDVRELGGLEKALGPLFELLGAENGVVPTQWLQAGRDILPTWDQAARLAPGVVTGDMSDLDEQRQGATVLRYATGMPIKQLTPAQKQSTARSKYYDERRRVLEMQAMERAMAS